MKREPSEAGSEPRSPRFLAWAVGSIPPNSGRVCVRARTGTVTV